MTSVVATAGRLWRAHWPTLMAWYIAGELARFGVIQMAGFVGAYSPLWGIMIVPVAILARLVSYVAMFLVLRTGLRSLEVPQALEDTRARRRTFMNALLVGILPFFAFYSSWGLLDQDMIQYAERALEIRFNIIAQTDSAAPEWNLFAFGVNWLTIGIVVGAYLARWLWGRLSSTMRPIAALVSVYLEAVWVFFTLFIVNDALSGAGAWLSTRVAFYWLGELWQWVEEEAAPLATLWNLVTEWVGTSLGDLLLLPLAWLTMAGVIYAQHVHDRVPTFSRFVPKHLREVRPGRRVAAVGADMAERLQPIWSAVLMMWRAGPTLVGGYILLWAGLVALERLGSIALTRVIGPHSLDSFWMVWDAAIFLIIPVVIEPLRVSFIAGTYDRMKRPSGASIKVPQ